MFLSLSLLVLLFAFSPIGDNEKPGKMIYIIKTSAETHIALKLKFPLKIEKSQELYSILALALY